MTSSGKIREFLIAQPASYPDSLAPGADGNLWFTESNATALGNIDPKTGKFGAPLRLCMARVAYRVNC